MYSRPLYKVGDVITNDLVIVKIYQVKYTSHLSLFFYECKNKKGETCLINLYKCID